MTQAKVIFDYLSAGNRITSWEATHKFGITRLAEIVRQVEKIYNVKVDRERKVIENRYKKKVSITEYWIANE